MARKKQTLFDNTANPSPQELRKQYKLLYSKCCHLEDELKETRYELQYFRNALDTAIYAATNNLLTPELIKSLIKFL